MNLDTSAVDLQAILAPIAGEQPCGLDLRSSAPAQGGYFSIKDLRSAARAAERSEELGPVVTAVEANRWRPLVDQAAQVLSTRSKDLEIAAWLVEGLARTHGFAGIRAGFQVVRGLVEAFWEGLHPRPDEEGLATRLTALVGLNGTGRAGTLVTPIARLPITAPSSARPIATWEWKRASTQAGLPDAHSAVAEGAEAETLESVIRKSGEQTPPEFFRQNLAEIDAALAELKLLGVALDERCGPDSPPGSALVEALLDCRSATLGLAGGRLGDNAEAAESKPVQENPQNSATPGGRAPTIGIVTTREDAFQQMLSLAEFFRRTEPHSPLPFLLERAVRWGRMPLQGLLAELIPDDTARENFAKLTGVPFQTP